MTTEANNTQAKRPTPRRYACNQQTAVLVCLRPWARRQATRAQLQHALDYARENGLIDARTYIEAELDRRR